MHALIDFYAEDANHFCGNARVAQSRWALEPVRRRLRFFRELRLLIAANAEMLAAATAEIGNRTISEKLVSEVLPLADACRWLERNSARVLASRRCGRSQRPLWLKGVSFEVQRLPFGVVLVIGPGNYPLFLPAVHALHALAAGNAVLLKPAPGTRSVALMFAQLVQAAGFDPALLTILPESVEAAKNAIADGVDKVIFTGSSGNGRDVLAALAQTNTPSVMELSGEDPVIVLADADLDLVFRALQFGGRLNDGATCVAPRRLIVEQSVAQDLRRRLAQAGTRQIPLQIFCTDDDALEQVNRATFALGRRFFHATSRAPVRWRDEFKTVLF